MNRKILLLVLLCMMLLAISASADELIEGKALLYQDGIFPEVPEVSVMATGDTQAAYELICDAVLNVRSEVSVASCAITASELNQIIANVVNENPILFYVSSSYRYTILSNGTVSRIIPVYLYSASEIEEMKGLVEDELVTLKMYIEDDMSDFEKVLAVHSYLVSNFEYDKTYSIYNIYDFFNTGKGVCQAYFLANIYFLRDLGIECRAVTSRSMNHGWNLVKVDGVWYHLDVTYDDPLINSNDYQGFCQYEYFLKSDTAMSGDHYDWTAAFEATDTTYDDSFLNNYNAPIYHINENWYVADYFKILNIDIQNGNTTTVMNAEKSGAPTAWKNNRYSFSCGIYGYKYLIYNTYNSVKALDLETNQTQTLLTSDETIFGLAVKNSVVTYRVAERLTENSRNLVSYDLSSIIKQFGFKIKSLTVENGVAEIEYLVDKTYDGDYSVFIAGYDEDGGLVFAKKVSERTVNVDDASEYKAFIWDNLKPLC